MSDSIPFDRFWEALEQRLKECSAEELRNIILKLALEVPPFERQTFLDQLDTSNVSAHTPITPSENLLEDIEDLVREMQEDIPPPDPWEVDLGWFHKPLFDEDWLNPYLDFVEPLTTLFERATYAFDNGEIMLARQAYYRLFEIVEPEYEDYRDISFFDLEDLDHQGIVARYLRSVYETTPLTERPEVLYKEMLRFTWHNSIYGKAMGLEDIVQISPRPLPEWEAFLKAWIAFLQPKNEDWADVWLREAIRMAEGTAGLERLARTEGLARPFAYVDWFAALEKEKKYAELLAAAREALEQLPRDFPTRTEIADYLCKAASMQNDIESLRAGRWEAFVSHPSFARLLDLWETFPSSEERLNQMRRAAQYLEQSLANAAMRAPASFPPFGLPPSTDADTLALLLAHARLLSGDLAKAHATVAEKDVLGWSSNSSDQALVLSFLLVLLSGQPREALSPNVEHLWLWILHASASHPRKWKHTSQMVDDLVARADRIYANYLAEKKLRLEKEVQEQYLAWCLDIAHKRVEAIVSHQSRESYGEAATLTIACAEVLRQRGEHAAAEAWVRTIRERFPRHRAFQREIGKALRRGH